MTYLQRLLFSALLCLLFPTLVRAQAKPPVGLIPKAKRPIIMDGKLDEWEGEIGRAHV